MNVIQKNFYNDEPDVSNANWGYGDCIYDALYEMSEVSDEAKYIFSVKADNYYTLNYANMAESVTSDDTILRGHSNSEKSVRATRSKALLSLAGAVNPNLPDDSPTRNANCREPKDRNEFSRVNDSPETPQCDLSSPVLRESRTERENTNTILNAYDGADWHPRLRRDMSDVGGSGNLSQNASNDDMNTYERCELNAANTQEFQKSSKAKETDSPFLL